MAPMIEGAGATKNKYVIFRKRERRSTEPTESYQGGQD